MDVIIFGISGNLAQKKLLPALRELRADNELPKDTHIIGFARSDKHKSDDVILVQGDYANKEDIEKLKHILRPNVPKLFYFSIPQKVYIPLLTNLEGIPNSQLLIEKPFGLNGTDAEQLQTFIAQHFKEEDIYRVDHYAGKTELRGSIPLSTKDISHIEVRLLEKVDVEDRAGFYAEVGALYDVGQNHLLFSLAALLSPRNRNDILRNLVYIPEDSTFAQYEGFEADKVETFFNIHAKIKSPEFEHIDISFTSGKALGVAESSVSITNTSHTKQIITLTSGTEAYKNIFRDALKKKKSSFLTYEEVISSWKFIELAKKDSLSKVLRKYPKGSLPEDIISATIKP